VRCPLTQYAAFLRAVNVGGHSMIKMDLLVQDLKVAGLQDVSSYRQSGNLILESAKKDEASTIKTIMEQLEQMTGGRHDVFLLPIERLKEIVDTDPFANHLKEGDRGFATFMSGHPTGIPPLPMMLRPEITLARVVDEIAFSMVEKDVGSGPVNDLVERLFSVKATTRNWSTVISMVKIRPFKQS
jgi:uncharacterized protein (DUF1697 family)